AAIFARSGGERPYVVRNELAEVMYDKAGIFRTSERLTECLDKVHELRERIGKVVVDDGQTFNTDLTSVFELESMLEAADCLVTSGLAREESRGAHTRLDFPERDDDKWMRHTLSWHDAGEVRLDYKPVTITKYQPQVRSY
ncbi:MAG: succinate dehydrogenase/fumarate reductase flavoprotein subunit, partial [Gaiellales bacterium]